MPEPEYIQPAGMILAVLTFLTIAAGHVLVRLLQARFGVKPGPPLLALGAFGLVGTLFLKSDLLSAAAGITAITIIWDGIEIYRQEKRKKREKTTHN